MPSLRYLIAAAALVWLAGCELPTSVHPLSDDTTSTFDEGLIGYWELVPPAERQPEPGDVPARLIFGRCTGKPNILECVTTELDGDGLAKVNRNSLYPCKLGELQCMSVLANPDEPQEKQVYLLMLYEVHEENELKFFLLNKDVIGPAIEREDLAGIVKKSDPDPNDPPPDLVKPKYREIKLTAPTKVLKAYLQRRGRIAFNSMAFITLRRVNPN